MNLNELKPAYTMHDMVKVLRRVDELTRENTALRKQLAETKEQFAAVQSENADLTAQLYDLQGDFARHMTVGRILPLNRAHEC
jgi:cell division protein FtsB